MVKMNFQNPTLEKIVRRFKWARNNSIQIFEQAEKGEILNYSFKSQKFQFQPLVFEFQCLITTTDTYIRKINKDENQEFGIIIKDDKIINKKEIDRSEVKPILIKQAIDLENSLRIFDDIQFDNEIVNILSILNHEFLHQGELILMLREAGIDLPERFKKAFAL